MPEPHQPVLTVAPGPRVSNRGKVHVDVQALEAAAAITRARGGALAVKPSRHDHVRVRHLRAQARGSYQQPRRTDRRLTGRRGHTHHATRSSSRSGDSGDDGPGEPEPHHVVTAPRAKVASLTARLARIALELGEVTDGLSREQIADDEWLLIPAINHVRISWNWLETISYEIDAHGRYYGETGRTPVPIASTGTRAAA